MARVPMRKAAQKKLAASGAAKVNLTEKIVSPSVPPEEKESKNSMLDEEWCPEEESNGGAKVLARQTVFHRGRIRVLRFVLMPCAPRKGTYLCRRQSQSCQLERRFALTKILSVTENSRGGNLNLPSGRW
jgi:hypothetical protein